MHRILLPAALVALAACAAAPGADSARPALLPTEDILSAAGDDRIAPTDATALAARAEALQARGRSLAATPVAGPPVP